MSGPLRGLKVLDLSRILSGPFCTMILADLGAEVVKIEETENGDPARGSGPFLDGESSYFMSLNRNKKSVTIDLSKDEGRKLLLDMVEKADVLVENFRPGTMEKFGLEYETLKSRNARLIYASITGFGHEGPYALRPALDVIIQGMGGIMSLTGEPGRPPVRPGSSYADIVAGMFACIGLLSALREREQSGRGQFLDISMLDSQVAVLENAFARYFATGEIPGPLGTRHPVFSPFQAFQTADGYIVIALIGGDRNQWALFCSALGLMELIDDERYQTGWSRTENYVLLEPRLGEALKKKTTLEWIKELTELGIPCGPINNIAQVAEDPQIKHRNMIIEIDHPKLKKVKAVNTPLRFSRTKPEIKESSPGLGQHTDRILREWLGLTGEEISKLRGKKVI